MRPIGDRELRPHHLVLGVATAVVVAVVLVLGIGRVAGFADVRAAVRGAHVGWLAVCVVGQVAVFTGYAGALRTAMADGGGPRVPTALSLRLTLASFAATQVFAFAGAGGLAVVYWSLRRSGRQPEDAAVRLIGLNTGVYLVFGVLGWVAALWALLVDAAPAGMTVPWIVAVPVVLVLARWFTDPARVDRWTDPVPAPAPDRSSDPAAEPGWTRRALAVGVGAAAWVRRSLQDPAGRGLFGWASLYWVGDVASLWAALRAFGGHPGLAALLAAYTTGYLVQSLPIPLIATGGVDAATTFLLHAVGVPLDVALVGVVAHRVFAFWLPVIPGAVFALTLPSAGRELAALAPTEPP